MSWLKWPLSIKKARVPWELLKYFERRFGIIETAELLFNKYLEKNV